MHCVEDHQGKFHSFAPATQEERSPERLLLDFHRNFQVTPLSEIVLQKLSLTKKTDFTSRKASSWKKCNKLVTLWVIGTQTRSQCIPRNTAVIEVENSRRKINSTVSIHTDCRFLIEYSGRPKVKHSGEWSWGY